MLECLNSYIPLFNFGKLGMDGNGREQKGAKGSRMEWKGVKEAEGSGNKQKLTRSQRIQL